MIFFSKKKKLIEIDEKLETISKRMELLESGIETCQKAIQNALINNKNEIVGVIEESSTFVQEIEQSNTHILDKLAVDNNDIKEALEGNMNRQNTNREEIAKSIEECLLTFQNHNHDTVKLLGNIETESREFGANIIKVVADNEEKQGQQRNQIKEQIYNNINDAVDKIIDSILQSSKQNEESSIQSYENIVEMANSLMKTQKDTSDLLSTVESELRLVLLNEVMNNIDGKVHNGNINFSK